MVNERRAIRIANCSGFYGDRFSAPREQLSGQVDVLTGDYLAELTMSILAKARQRDPRLGYATTFLRQMEDTLGPALAAGIKIVVNAGGLNPGSLAGRLGDLARSMGLSPSIAYVDGDDLLPRLSELQSQGHAFRNLDTGQPLIAAGVVPATANAYLGGWGIATALGLGADIVVCPRVTDASLVTGPAAWWFGWSRTDWNELAGAVIAGHVLECGAQATGGNYSFFTEIPGLEHPGFPVAEVFADGRSIITKDPSSGGAVTVGTVTAQLLYEIDSPRYLNPDVVALFDSVSVKQVGPDRVEIAGAHGEPAPADLKLSINYTGGFRNSMTFALVGLNIEEKAALVERTLLRKLSGPDRPAELEFQLVRSGWSEPTSTEAASSFLHVHARDSEPDKVGRAFSGAVVELALASYPGLHLLTPPASAHDYSVHWPSAVNRTTVQERVHLADRSLDIPALELDAGGSRPTSNSSEAVGRVGSTTGTPARETRRVALGGLFGARSGDKGGNANVGVWARTHAAYVWLSERLTSDHFQTLLPETQGFRVERYELPNLLAINFVIFGLLGEGVAASTRFDPQAKSLGEMLRARMVDLPVDLLEGTDYAG
jgi:hypothetical protein